ncbi:hypothetical protein LCGC14_1891050 [marine sediment metagenome]|uniref:Uncharacterized protein n=1 Tax=marine sediment metagenome TaxID=412755 RepID=A0A0F9FZI5_9ZZZZ
MRRKWKLGCGASLEVLKTGDESLAFTIHAVGNPRDGWFAELKADTWPGFVNGSDVKLVFRRKAIPRLIKVLQYLEKVKA